MLTSRNCCVSLVWVRFLPQRAPVWKWCASRTQAGAFLSGGFDALSDKPRPGKRETVSAETLWALASEIGKGDRTWNSVQAQAWLALRGVSLKRTAHTLRHKQNAEEVAEKQVALATVQKGGMSST